MVCVTTNERTTFCRPSPGGETGGRSQSVHKGIISEGWGKSGCHNHGVLVTGEKSSSEYAECTGPDVPKRVDRPLQNRHKFTFKISKIISSRRASFCLIPTFCDFTKCRDWKCTQSIENTLTRCLKVNHSLELAHSAPCVWTSIIVSAKCSSKKISRKKDTQNRFKLPPPGRSHWIYSARQNRSSSRLTEPWGRHRWGHLDELCQHQVFACSSEELLFFVSMPSSSTFLGVSCLSSSSTSGIVVSVWGLTRWRWGCGQVQDRN